MVCHIVLALEGEVQGYFAFGRSLLTLNEVMNKKPITPEDELQDALDEKARYIALIEPNPVDWGGWITYMLEQKEGDAG